MTIIIGYIDEENRMMHMFGDTQGTDGSFNKTVRHDDKVFQKGDMLFGFTSSYRMGQLLKYKLKIPQHLTLTMSDSEYMYTLFIDAVIELFEKNGFQKKENEVKEGGEFLVAYRGTLYRVHCDYQIEVSVDNFHTCGCGREYAIGALNVLVSHKKKNQTINSICTESIETAIKYSAGCGGHITNVSLNY